MQAAENLRIHPIIFLNMAAILDVGLSKETSVPGLRRAIINSMFARTLSENDYNSRSAGLDSYFSEWYEEQCRGCKLQVSVTMHREILEVIAQLRKRQYSRVSITAGLCQPDMEEAEIKKIGVSVILAAHLLLMMSIGEIDHFISPGRTVAWSSSNSISDTVQSEFPLSEIEETDSLPKLFKAANLERIAGIRVQWTSNLADHLLLKENEVRLFHHVSFLHFHKDNPWLVTCLT